MALRKDPPDLIINAALQAKDVAEGGGVLAFQNVAPVVPYVPSKVTANLGVVVSVFEAPLLRVSRQLKQAHEVLVIVVLSLRGNILFLHEGGDMGRLSPIRAVIAGSELLGVIIAESLMPSVRLAVIESAGFRRMRGASFGRRVIEEVGTFSVSGTAFRVVGNGNDAARLVVARGASLHRMGTRNALHEQDFVTIRTPMAIPILEVQSLSRLGVARDSWRLEGNRYFLLSS